MSIHVEHASSCTFELSPCSVESLPEGDSYLHLDAPFSVGLQTESRTVHVEAGRATKVEFRQPERRGRRSGSSFVVSPVAQATPARGPSGRAPLGQAQGADRG